MTDFSIGAAQIEEFRVSGYVKFRNAIPLDRVYRVRDALAQLTRSVAKRIAITVPDDVDTGYLIDSVLPGIYAANPRAGGFVFDTIRSHSSLYTLYHSPSILIVASRFLGVDEIEIVEKSPNFILQIPGDRQRINGWHQESPYMSEFFSSEKTLFVWIPVSAATIDRGAIWVVPGSHLDGMLPHQTNSFGEHMDRDWDENGEAFLKKSQFEVEKAKQIEGSPGDMVVLDFNVIHKSGLNHAPATRLTGIFRLGTYTGRGYLPKYDIAIA